LYGSAESTQKALEVKMGLRLSEISGDLRGQPAEIFKPATEFADDEREL
jgi:hypothetical protein